MRNLDNICDGGFVGRKRERGLWLGGICGDKGNLTT